jgi:NAD+ synthase (glutamine-hydrolysing)
MAQSSQYSLKPVDIITATVSMEEVRSYRSSISRNIQAAAQPEFPRIECDIRLGRTANEVYLSDNLSLTREIELKTLDPMEEIAHAEAVFLWQYLTRTNSPGYFLALSGGLDSSTVALFVYSMARVVLTSINAGETTTLNDLRRITGDKAFTPTTPEEIVARVFVTCCEYS